VTAQDESRQRSDIAVPSERVEQHDGERGEVTGGGSWCQTTSKRDVVNDASLVCCFASGRTPASAVISALSQRLPAVLMTPKNLAASFGSIADFT